MPMPCRSYAGGRVGNGCVGEYHRRARRRAVRGAPRSARPARRWRGRRRTASPAWWAGRWPRCASPDGDVRQDRRARQIVVPELVVRELEVPAPLAGPDVQGDEAVGEQVVARPMAAVEVVGRRLRRHVDQAERLVGRHLPPGAGVAGVRTTNRSASSRGRTRPRSARYGNPQPPARPRVVAPHVTFHVTRAGRHDPAGRVVRGVAAPMTMTSLAMSGAACSPMSAATGSIS